MARVASEAMGEERSRRSPLTRAPRASLARRGPMASATCLAVTEGASNSLMAPLGRVILIMDFVSLCLPPGVAGWRLYAKSVAAQPRLRPGRAHGLNAGLPKD